MNRNFIYIVTILFLFSCNNAIDDSNNYKNSLRFEVSSYEFDEIPEEMKEYRFEHDGVTNFSKNKDEYENRKFIFLIEKEAKIGILKINNEFLEFKRVGKTTFEYKDYKIELIILKEYPDKESPLEGQYYLEGKIKLFNKEKLVKQEKIFGHE